MMFLKESLTNHRKGLVAESIAGIYLRLKGYRILQKRYRTPVGEIDIIGFKKDTIVFVEVKCRKTGDEAKESISIRNQERVRRAAEFFLARGEGRYHIRHGVVDKYARQAERGDVNTRFDAIVIGNNFHLEHIQNAW